MQQLGMHRKRRNTKKQAGGTDGTVETLRVAEAAASVPGEVPLLELSSGKRPRHTMACGAGGTRKREA